MEYLQIKDSQGFNNFLKLLYTAKPGDVTELNLPAINYLTIAGTGRPQSDHGPFQEAIGALYTIAYTLKMGLKHGKITQPFGYFDYKVATFGAQWWTEGQPQFDINYASWKLFMPLPPFITPQILKAAVDQASQTKKGQHMPLSQVKLETSTEGTVVQTLHIGPWDKELPSIQLLRNHLQALGHSISCPHQEIYLSDPRRVPEEKWRTLIRYAYI